MSTQHTPSTNRYEKYAASAAENYERHFVPAIGEPSARRLLAHAHLTSGERVLDVGCGTGIVTRLAAEAVGPGGRVEGLDANPDMIDVARTISPDVHWHVAPAGDMPLPDGAFDVVLCALGLQFFPDRPEAMRHMHRALAPGGRAVVSTPGPTPPLFEAIDAALTNHVGPGASMLVHAVFSLHDPTEARELFESAGFSEITVDKRPLPLRVAPPADFFWQYVQSTPLGALCAELDEPERAALECEVAERCRPFTDGDATVMEPGMLVASGFRNDEEER